MFYTNFNRPPRKAVDCSEKMRQEYKIVYDETNGKRKCVKDKKVNIYEKIQEGAEEHEIKNLLKKYDINTMQRIKASEDKIVDLVNVPENLIQSMNIIKHAEQLFDMQSKETKREFNNDYRQFIAASEDGKLQAYINKHLVKRTPVENTAVNQTTQVQPAQQTTYVQPVQQTTSVQPVQQTTTEKTGGIIYA